MRSLLHVDYFYRVMHLSLQGDARLLNGDARLLKGDASIVTG